MKTKLMAGLIGLMLGWLGAGSGWSEELKTVEPAACMPKATDYAFMYWAEGWRGARRVMAFQTGEWGMAFDMERMRILRYGKIDAPLLYAEAARQDHGTVEGLPPAEMELSVTVDGERYRCVRGGEVDAKAGSKEWHQRYPFRIIESGRWLQRCDIQGLVFENEKKERLKAEGRLEIAAWPDRLSFLLELTPKEKLANARMGIRLETAAGKFESGGKGGEDFGAGATQRVALAILPGRGVRDESDEKSRLKAGQRTKGPNLVARDADAGTTAAVSHHGAHGWFNIELPEKQWDVARDFSHLDRLKVRLENPEGAEKTFRLCFAMDRPFPGITGMSPMLRDAAGAPTGIPVQISKNWHRQEAERLLYEGPWFHGFTMMRVAARSALELEFDLAYAGWGGLPAASHAQLCLIGWGTNQLWEQAAIGSWGESICYDPEVCLNRSMIDDVRPLMVTAMGERRAAKWGWTNNVGGGDFLVYTNEKNERQRLARMKTAYRRYGPNLTGVRYAGATEDGRIRACIDVATPRCDDVNRAFHHIRYDVVREAPFTRLAFYQVGADGYNDHTIGKLAWGNAEGLIEEWAPETGTLRYGRQGIACAGRAPWFSLHEGRGMRGEKGAWANRGLIVRSWKARLGGKEVPAPLAAVFGTRDGFPSANVELGAPPELKTLLPGDFVEAEVELVIMPQAEGDYYGPNEGLRAALKEGGNTWRPVWRLARGNELEVRATRGKVTRPYPIEVEAEGQAGAAIEISGGVGYVPVTFNGLSDAKGWKLWQIVDGKRTEVNQAVHGNDFWQADYDPARGTWSLTFNVSLDAPGDARRRVGLELERR